MASEVGALGGGGGGLAAVKLRLFRNPKDVHNVNLEFTSNKKTFPRKSSETSPMFGIHHF